MRWRSGEFGGRKFSMRTGNLVGEPQAVGLPRVVFVLSVDLTVQGPALAGVGRLGALSTGRALTSVWQWSVVRSTRSE